MSKKPLSSILIVLVLILTPFLWFIYIDKIRGWDTPIDGQMQLDRYTEDFARPLRISEIILQRKGCLGTCPVYSLTLRKDGTARYVGNRHVDRVGVYGGLYWQFPRLAAWVEMQHFTSFKNEYAEGVFDAEVVTTSIKIDGKLKTVTTYSSGDGPIELWAINSAIDGVASSIKWQKIK